jgi:hypothetical protein
MFGWMTNVMRPRAALVLSVAAAPVGLVLWQGARGLDVGRPLVGPESIQFPPGL